MVALCFLKSGLRSCFLVDVVLGGVFVFSGCLYFAFVLVLDYCLCVFSLPLCALGFF
jgi:hypothetical protein